MLKTKPILSHNTDIYAFENILTDRVIKQSETELISLDGMSEELCVLPVSLTKDLHMPTDLTDGCIGGDIKIILKDSIYDLNMKDISYNAYDYIDDSGEISDANLDILRGVFRDNNFYKFISSYNNTFNKAYNIEYTAKHLQKELDVFSIEKEISVYDDITTDFFEHIYIFDTGFENKQFKKNSIGRIKHMLKTLNIPYTMMKYEDFKGLEFLLA